MCESASQVLRRLVRQYCSNSDVVEKLSRQAGANINDIAQSVHTVLDIPTNLMSNSTLVAKAYHDVINYQRNKKHDKPPGLFNNREQLLAKRLFCEIMKEALQRWSLSSNGADDRVSKSEVQCHLDLVEHLLYYRDCFASKSERWQSGHFCEFLLNLDDSLKQLLQQCDTWDTGYNKILDDIYNLAASFCDNALCATVLGITNNHSELVQNLRGDTLSVSLLSRLRSNSAPMFWATDLGQVISAALVRGDPDSFKPLASVWTECFGTVRRSDFNSFNDAHAAFEEATRSRLCAVLTGPDGEHRNNRSRSFGAWRRMDDVTARHVLLQHAASSTARAFEEQVENVTSSQEALTDLSTAATPASSAAASFITSESSCPSHFDLSVAAGQTFSDQVKEVQRRWISGEMSQSGVAEAFRGQRKSSSVGTDAMPDDSHSSLLASILKLPVALSDLLVAFRHVMGEIRALAHGASTEMALMAIWALRRSSKFSKLLLASMDRFLDNASQVHRTFDQQWRKTLRGCAHMSDQVPELQRSYFESLKKCFQLRTRILTEWQQLELISDTQLQENVQGIMQSRGQAYRRLASPRVTALASAWDSTSLQSSQATAVEQLVDPAALEVD
mmetsp:Transcript_6073/g.11623  ORF Transcript_6073/g.11623 Transcript_6073/m.11623 type:complete len:617 (-) Transcript_6073:61-1911(-)